jgi:hypothetical protein
VALWLRRANGWITIACPLLIPISFWTGWIDSVRFISLITVIGLALGLTERVQSARVEVKQDGDS